MNGRPAQAALRPLARRIPELDSLRGLAASGILLLHAFPVALFWLWSCVDLFFVLSGYLITRILLEANTADWRVLRNFWARRILRIWPVYYLTLLASILLWLVHAPTLDFSWLRCVFFIQFAEGYLGHDAGYVYWFRHSWSLAAEEQFYLLWPFVLPLLARSLKTLMVGCATIVFVAILLRGEGLSVILLLTRADGLALGALLAAFHLRRGMPHGIPAPLLGGMTVAGVAMMLPHLIAGYSGTGPQTYNDIAYVGGWAWAVTGFALVFTALVALTVDGRAQGLARVLRFKPLVHLGQLSYAIYMFQGPLRPVIHALLPAPSLVQEGIVAAATILLAQLSRTFVEKPCEELRKRLPLVARAAHESAPA